MAGPKATISGGIGGMKVEKSLIKPNNQKNENNNSIKDDGVILETFKKEVNFGKLGRRIG